MRVAAYLRVSTEEQRDRQTIDGQRFEIERWASYQRHDVVAWYSDDGVSGTLPVDQRPHGSELLRALTSGAFDAVVIYKVDRIARSVLHTLRFVESLKAAEIKLLSVAENIDPDTPQGTMFLNMLSTFAQYQRDDIRERTQVGRSRVAREGRWNGGPAPFGYRLDETRRLAVEPGEAAIVREMYRLYATREYTTIELARYVNARHTLDKRHDWVAAILRSSTYVGRHVYRKERWYTNADGKSRVSGKATPDQQVIRDVPAIVDKELFDAVGDELCRKKALSMRNAKRAYLLRGLLRCDRCQACVSGMQKTDGVAYYRCIGRIAGTTRIKGCGVFARVERVETIVWAELENWLADPGPILERVAERARAETGDTGTAETERRELLTKIAEADQRRRRVGDMVERGMIGFAEGDDRVSTIKAEEAALRLRLDDLDRVIAQAARGSDRVAKADALMAELRGALGGPVDDAAKRYVAERIIRRVWVNIDPVGGGRSVKVRELYVVIDDRL